MGRVSAAPTVAEPAGPKKRTRTCARGCLLLPAPVRAVELTPAFAEALRLFFAEDREHPLFGMFACSLRGHRRVTGRGKKKSFFFFRTLFFSEKATVFFFVIPLGPHPALMLFLCHSKVQNIR